MFRMPLDPKSAHLCRLPERSNVLVDDLLIDAQGRPPALKVRRCFFRLLLGRFLHGTGMATSR